MATATYHPGITIACLEGRHGDHTRTVPAKGHQGFTWTFTEPCKGYARSLDGFDRECPCECHGETDPTIEIWWLE